jgi:hypothetical protein
MKNKLIIAGLVIVIIAAAVIVFSYAKKPVEVVEPIVETTTVPVVKTGPEFNDPERLKNGVKETETISPEAMAGKGNFVKTPVKQ